MPKPVPLEEHRHSVAEGNYILSVAISFRTSCNDEQARRVAQSMYGNIHLTVWDAETEDSKLIEIGYISGWRTLSFNATELEIWSDSIDQDVYVAFDWLVNRQTKIIVDELLLHPILLLDRVVIEPEWRGQGFTLPAVSTYLDSIACDFVFFIPSPPNAANLSKRECKRKQQILKRYWQKLGFENYDSKHNILWTEEWTCPSWLRARRG